MSVFRKKPLVIHGEEKGKLKRNLSALDLILLGLGAIVGTGIFVVTGTAAATMAGPALIISFILAAVCVALSGLCYAEFASRLPIIGGPYAYAYTIFGEIIGWLTGWIVICEFFLAVSSVASGWSGYVQGFLNSLGVYLPKALSSAYHPAKGTYVDLIAVLVVIFVTFVVCQEAKKALRLNNLMLFIKFGLIAIFVLLGVFYVKPGNWQPFNPFGTSGIIAGGAMVYFAFLGFDAVAMAAEEVKDPQKNVPRGIIGSIIISTVLYIVVTLVLTGMVPFTELNVKDPVAFAMRFVNHNAVGALISVGAIITLLTVIISMTYSLARMLYAISKDGLLPQFFNKVDHKHQVPKNATIFVGAVALIFAGVVPLQVLAELTNLAALVYFVILAFGLIRMRQTMGQPQKDEFRVPFVPVLPLVSIVVCLLLMSKLSLTTWLIFLVWVVLGLILYAVYGYKHSVLNNKE
ncbi:APC family permease [Enterococcus nangangensis]|uniref:APC family permease n=1 Tax=Enterococcus nangangensis TaxID=2559926 RepID=UPI0010F8BE84|nr:amino acid permease [Enterococcus nangangensis]